MFKKLTALVLASIMLLMPMTASAVTWGTIMQDLHTGNSSHYSYDDGATTVEMPYNDSYIVIKGGTVEDIAIEFNPNNNTSSTIYDFYGVTVVGDTLFIGAKDSQSNVYFDSNSTVDVANVIVEVSNGGAYIGNYGNFNTDLISVDASNKGYFALNNSENANVNSKNGISVNVENSESYIYNSGSLSTENGIFENATGDYSYVIVYNSGSLESNVIVSANDKASVGIDNYDTLKGDVLVSTNDDAHAFVINGSGKIDGELYVSATGDSTQRLSNSGEIDSLYVDQYDNATFSTYKDENQSTVKDGTINRAVVYVNTPEGSAPTSEQIQNVLSTIDLKNLSDNVSTELWTYDENGDWVARYAIDENGAVTLIEYLNGTEEEEDSEPSPEMIRHWMEEKRKAEAIGGVYGSPYWVKQLYLGYHSLNLRIFENGERQLFRQSLSWIVEERAKRLTLWVRNENPENLTMRFDEEVLDILDRAEFSTVTLQDGNHDLYMEYKVADLRAAYEKYGLSGTDLLVVGDMDTEVMKIGADGKLVPVEEEAETAGKS